jgi:Flp pilus assembly protein TadB
MRVPWHVPIWIARMKRRRREQWMSEVERSQRNIVFPDTAKNERRFWNEIINGNRHLTISQIFIICVYYAFMAFCVVVLFRWMRYSVLPWVLLVLMACSFILLQWRVRKALRNERHDSKN